MKVLDQSGSNARAVASVQILLILEVAPPISNGYGNGRRTGKELV